MKLFVFNLKPIISLFKNIIMKLLIFYISIKLFGMPDVFCSEILSEEKITDFSEIRRDVAAGIIYSAGFALGVAIGVVIAKLLIRVTGS